MSWNHFGCYLFPIYWQEQPLQNQVGRQVDGAIADPLNIFNGIAYEVVQ